MQLIVVLNAKKVVWLQVAAEYDESAKRKSLLKSKGLKEWTNPTAKGSQKKWKLRYGSESKTGTLLSIFIREMLRGRVPSMAPRFGGKPGPPSLHI